MRRWLTPILLLLLLLLLLPLGGCFVDAGDGTQTGTEVPDHCVESGRTTVAHDEQLDDLGFSPDDLLGVAAGSFSGTFSPYSGSSSALTYDVARSSADIELVSFTMVMRTVDTSEPQSEGPPGPTDCPPHLEVPVSVGFVTADGAFDEAFTGALVATEATSATLSTSEPLADVGGTARPSFQAQDWPNQTLQLDAQLATGWTGSLTWMGSTDDPGGDTGTINPSGETAGAGSFTAQ